MSALDEFKDGLDELCEDLGETVTYYHEASDTTIAGVVAVRGRSNWDAESPQPGVKVGTKSAAWTLQVSQLVDSGSNQLMPGRDDTITDENGDVFKCLPVSKQAPLYEWVLRNSHVRIHTKEQ